ncbi:hypothetical protein PPL_09480 [Heterostelium album PN500]|uniref:Uncharacterized protein n=1 Tax=Heterostelium pallidum (strain ATCC 26659 / Pp 5 / PN500) TaxID=670386 RepID=D3BN69_HETP5|nr:hypothetical protein PPL_09480 [Heterostelium album PN500]EFA76729.1 hypothetical protein PPL_09480 [Heterostelium album PN500]|eukprot:XP_020428861.1 hypothetical protein PPL_09480 [Heterostelium album PN500]
MSSEKMFRIFEKCCEYMSINLFCEVAINGTLKHFKIIMETLPVKLLLSNQWISSIMENTTDGNRDIASYYIQLVRQRAYPDFQPFYNKKELPKISEHMHLGMYLYFIDNRGKIQQEFNQDVWNLFTGDLQKSLESNNYTISDWIIQHLQTMRELKKDFNLGINIPPMSLYVTDIDQHRNATGRFKVLQSMVDESKEYSSIIERFRKIAVFNALKSSNYDALLYLKEIYTTNILGKGLTSVVQYSLSNIRWIAQIVSEQYCEHINIIKKSLDNILVSSNVMETDSSVDNTNSNNEDSEFSKSIKSIWDSLKSSSLCYHSLSVSENEITQHFEQLHQYLITEEHKLKKSIINDKETIINYIDNNINKLKYIVNILKINNKLNNDIENNKSNDDDDNSDKDNSNDGMSIIEDTSSQYSTATIMESITSSSSLKSFIIDNNQTLFSDQYDPFNASELIKQHNNDRSLLLLDLIYKYNNQFKSSTITNSASSYQVTIKQHDFNQLNLLIDQSIKLSKKGTYIFTTHRDKGATLIDISNNNSIDEIYIDYNFYGTFQSIISIGEYIYLFGGHHNLGKWMKFSIKSKSIEKIGYLEGINDDFNISVCYDGLDHIYLVSGGKTNRIDRFNIKTMKFDHYHKLPKEYYSQVSTMIFKGALYSVSQDQNLIFKLDLANRTVTEQQIDTIPYTACHDNNGNFFIFDRTNARFIKYNVEDKQTVHLYYIPALDGRAYLRYYRESPTSSFIYSFGGVRYGNFKYSIEDNQCEPFLKNDNLERHWCGSIVINY